MLLSNNHPLKVTGHATCNIAYTMYYAMISPDRKLK
jgi:hypothetical protein